ncbi:hypothetical protein Htur_5101 (plasmid) [Haloterrigena turkmenica DSM 5511]|uniref:Uncharacterized protein n=1 Tax=Haloterrigena turkmenica (strain ATCC 51198 / DSM 5511 / JCM 9101 / NCIMB 13204 / VKM B-1734 / 4k) TaxID=543526 RepID=D2S3P1_HALTV|nr:hypothetical protein Htur_5101 [Haloterrigena turkmenica DSM 5511]
MEMDVKIIVIAFNDKSCFRAARAGCLFFISSE